MAHCTCIYNRIDYEICFPYVDLVTLIWQFNPSHLNNIVLSLLLSFVSSHSQHSELPCFHVLLYLTIYNTACAAVISLAEMQLLPFSQLSILHPLPHFQPLPSSIATSLSHCFSIGRCTESLESYGVPYPHRNQFGFIMCSSCILCH